MTADSRRWTGKVEAPVTGSYTFTARGDDGVRLYLSGTKVIDGWSDHGATDFNYTTNLTRTKYDIELHFYEHGVAPSANCNGAIRVKASRLSLKAGSIRQRIKRIFYG